MSGGVLESYPSIDQHRQKKIPGYSGRFPIPLRVALYAWLLFALTMAHGAGPV